MNALQYVGRYIGADKDLVYRSYIEQVKAGDLTIAEIDNVIDTGLAGYATIGYVDSRDALNATKAYVDAGDAARLKLAQKSVSNGAAPLDATGRVPSTRINGPLTQKWVRGPWTPVAYPVAPVSVTTPDTALYTCPVTDPGYPYKLVVYGMIDARSSHETEHPVVYIRVGGTTGEIVAQGRGSAEVPDAAAPVTGETFGIPNPDGLDTDNWNQTVLSGTAGHYQVINNQAQWVQSGTGERTYRFRRLGTDAVTLTDYQKLRFVIGTAKGELATFPETEHWVRACARMNTAESDWVGFACDTNTFAMLYSVDGNVAAMSGAGWTSQPSNATVSTTSPAGTIYDVLAGTVNNVRQFIFYRNNVVIGGAVDNNSVTRVDSGHRGWGWYAFAGHRTFDQSDPPDVADILIADAPPSFGSVSVLPMGNTTTRTGSTVLYVMGSRSGAASTQVFSPYRPRLSVFVVPA